MREGDWSDRNIKFLSDHKEVTLMYRGESKMLTLGAVMSKLVHLCFGILKAGLPERANYAVQA